MPVQKTQNYTGTKTILISLFLFLFEAKFFKLFTAVSSQNTLATVPLSQYKLLTVKKYIILAPPFIVQIKNV